MKVEKMVVGELRENCYLIKKDGKCIIVDPGSEANKIIDACKGYEVVEVLVTHHHFDHVGALDEILNKYHLNVNECSGLFDYEIIKTPGHTSDSISFYFKNEHILFSGDFLFYHTIGRTDLETSSNEDMKKSLELIRNYPDDTVVYPGHGFSSVLGKEKKLFDKYFSMLIY